ncbi:MAG: dockerin type I domain-containing protein [Casimicrobium sp.]
MKKVRATRMGQLVVGLIAGGMMAFSAQATQTVNPFTAATGGTNMNGTTVPFTSDAVTFYGRYSTTTAAAESGLGVKVKFNSAHVSLAVSEEYDGCRIAAAQVQTPTTPGVGGQAVMGWIDTSIRTSGAVGWPNVAEPAASGGLAPCLDPGNINGTPTGSATDLKLFKIVATRVPGFTTGTTTISIESDGNYSYAGGTAGFDNKSFTINAAGSGGGTFALAASNPYVSRKTHNGTDFDITLNAAAVITGTGAASGATIEPRQATGPNPHKVVFRFAQAVSSAGSVTAATQSGASVTATTSVSGNDVIVSLSGVTDRSRVQVSLNGVTSSAATGTLSPSVVVGFLAGDADGNGTVQAPDVLFVQQRLNSTAQTAGNRFRADMDSNGTVQAPDVLFVQQRLNRTLQ